MKIQLSRLVFCGIAAGAWLTFTITAYCQATEVARVHDAAGGTITNASYRSITAIGQGQPIGVQTNAIFKNYAGFLRPLGKSDQAISDFLPTNGSIFITTDLVGLSATASSGLGVLFAVASGPATISGGTNLSFAGTGEVRVVASQAGDANWNPAPDVTNTFNVLQAAQAALVFAPTSPQTYNTTNLLSATGGSGTGTVSYAVLSGPGEIVGADGLKATSGTGEIVVEASKAADDLYLVQAASATVTAAKASSQVFLIDLAQTYDGTARTVTATTMPAGLTVSITYNGSAIAPTNVGTYAVTGTINDVMYQGSATGSLVVAKGGQTITFPPIDDQLTTNMVHLAATASSELSVSFMIGGGPATITGGTNVTFSGTGMVRIVASQVGNSNWNPAPQVTNAFNVSEAYSVAVSNLSVVQRPGTKLVDITYDVSSTGGGDVRVSLTADDSGVPLGMPSLSGDIGSVVPGHGKSMTWDMGADWDGNIAVLSFSLTAEVDALPLPANMLFVQGGALNVTSKVITVSSFLIGKYEVTWGNWKSGYNWAITNGYVFDNTGSGITDNHPVVNINWYDVVKWCNACSQRDGRTPVYIRTNGVVYKQGHTADNEPTVVSSANGYRLPTTNEWEFAARGGLRSHGYIYSGSTNLAAVGWYSDNSGGSNKTVGTKAANELGIRDMSGNVWEWCFDWFSLNSRRGAMGGGYVNAYFNCQVNSRLERDLDEKWDYLGVRIVCPTESRATSQTDRKDVLLDSRDYLLLVTSSHGAPFPAAGTNMYSWRSVVTCTVAATTTEGGITWRNSGWAGTGSIPAVGTTNTTASIMLTNVTSSIAWQWEQQSAFAIANMVATQRVGTKLVDITYDIISELPEPAPISLAVEQGGTPLVVSSLMGDVGADILPGVGKAVVWDAGADWNRNAAELTFMVMHSDQTQIVSSGMAFVDTRDYCTLLVNSAHGTPAPAVGAHVYEEGAIVTNSLSGSPISSGLTVRVCAGWNMEGNDPTNGVGTNFVATITNDATLTWLWGTNVWLSIAARAHGSADGSGWYALGGSVTVTAVPNAGFQFTGWMGDVPTGQEDSNPLTLTMDRARFVEATFFATYYVAAATGNDTNSGLSWATAKQTIQSALTDACEGDTVVVSNGVYGAIVVPSGVVVRSVNGAENTQIGPVPAGTRAAYLETGASLAGFAVTGADVILDGAGIYAESGAQVEACIVSGNATAGAGGGVYGGSLVNCLIYGNAASNGAGAVDANLTYCTVANNTATNAGGGTKDCTLLSSIVYGNAPDNNNGGSATYSCMAPLLAGTGNITNDPVFANAAGENFRLAYESPCLGVASSSGVNVDLAGSPRPQPTVYGGALGYDMGCYEYVPQARFVWTNGNAVAPYETWVDAAKDVQSALDVSSGGDRIVVEAGTYMPFTVSNAVVLLGYRGASNTVVDGGGAQRPVTITAPATLEGFTVQNGAAEDCGGILADDGAIVRNVRIYNNQATAPGGYGGGLCLYNGSMAESVVVVSNQAQYGAGVYATATSKVRTSTIFLNSSALGWGGGLYLEDASALSESLVEGNSCARGGGVYADESEIATTAIRGNLASEYGGGVAIFGGMLRNSWIEDNDSWSGAGIYASDAFSHSCIVAGNVASARGGGVYLAGTGVVYNLTIVTNQAAAGGGGVWINGGGRLWNSIAMFNSPSNLAPGSGDIQYSCIAPPPTGTGNYEADPLFVATNDFHLRAGSPCVDAGTNEIWMAENQDIDGQRRVFPMPPDDHPDPVRDVWIDIGADEAAVDAFSGPSLGNPFWGWNVVVDAHLQMQATTNLLIPVLWTNIGTVVTANQATLSIPYTNSDRMRGFRLIWVKP